MKNQLVLYPSSQISSTLHQSQVIQWLEDKQIITAINAPISANVFLTGQQFMQRISFVGCSPVINLGDQSQAEELGLPKLEIEVSVIYPKPRLLVGENTRAPKCPVCGVTMENWRDHLLDGVNLKCTACNAQTPASGFQWAKQGAYTQTFLSINGIYPREAVPLDSFLTELASLYESPMKYCYLQNAVVLK